MLKRRRQKSYGRKQLAKAAKAAKKLGKQKAAAKSPAA
jgi:hypothetical protein